MEKFRAGLVEQYRATLALVFGLRQSIDWSADELLHGDNASICMTTQ